MYKHLFDPEMGLKKDLDLTALRPGADRSERIVYDYSDDLVLAINVALATGRPLLLYGAPGTGKSSVARHVAMRTCWRYYEKLVTSRTTAEEMLWSFDTLRRFQDAHAGEKNLNPVRYLEPGIFWWAFDRESARKRGLKENEEPEIQEPRDPGTLLVADGSEMESESGAGAVILLDEIDKADPDLPNNLLGVLGSLNFYVPEIRTTVNATHPPLVFITTNHERDLPEPFLRRCVTLTLPTPTKERMYRIARLHFPAEKHPAITESLLSAIYNRLDSLNEQSRSNHSSHHRPSTAEFLDAVAACASLGVSENEPLWQSIMNATLEKRDSRA